MKFTHQRFILFWLMLASVALGALSQQPSFNLVPPRSVVEGRNFTLTFRLTDGEANPPSAPRLENCSLLYGPSTSTMQSTQIINGKMSSSYSIDYSYVYRADKPGSVTVPELSVNVNGKTLRSRTATFNILPDDRQSSQQGGGHNVQADDPSTQQPGRVSADDLLIRVFFSKSSVYEQEPVVATIKVYTKYDINSFLVTTQPAFEGFLCEELPVQLEMNLEHYNGQNYHTAVVKRLLLYPQKAGQLSVNSGKYDVTIVQYEQVNMGFFRTSRPIEKVVTTSSNAATLSVKALPQPQPEGFNGAVGRFNASVSLTPELLRTNEAATYSYTVSGTGNIKFLNEPKIDFPAGIDTYTPKNEIDTRVNGANMSGTFRTDFTIVPQEVGNFTIPATPFVYFDPEKKEYVTIDTKAFDIKVARGASTSAVATEQTVIDKSMDDILHIRNTRGIHQSHDRKFVFYSAAYWLAYAVALLALVVIVLVYRRQIRLNADITGRKLARAGRVANKRLREARGFMNSKQNGKFYESLAKALWGYISDKLSIPPSQLMRDNIAEKLEAYGLDNASAASVIEVLDLCEMARFTPVHSDEEVADLYSKAVGAIKSIEDVKR